MKPDKKIEEIINKLHSNSTSQNMGFMEFDGVVCVTKEILRQTLLDFKDEIFKEGFIQGAKVQYDAIEAKNIGDENV